MDYYTVLYVVLIMLSVFEMFDASRVRVKLDNEATQLGKKLHRVTDSLCGKEVFLPLKSGQQIQILYDGASLNGRCVIHIINTDTNRYTMTCIELDDVFNYDDDFDCWRNFKFYFSDYPSKNASRYYSCKDIHQNVCDTRMAAHALFESSYALDRPTKFQIKISILKRPFKRSSPESWSTWTTRNDRVSSKSMSYEKQNEKAENSGANFGVILVCVLGIVIVLIFCAMCRKWRKYCCSLDSAENHESAPEQRPEYSAVHDSQTMYSELPRHVSSPASGCTAMEISTNNGEINTASHSGQDTAYGVLIPSITSLIEDNVGTRDHHMTLTDHNRESSAAPVNQLSTTSAAYISTPTPSSTSNEDTTLISNHEPNVAYTGPAPTISSLIDEYLATRDHPAPSEQDRESPATHARQVSPASDSSSSTSSTPSTSNEETRVISNNGPDVAYTRPEHTITSLIDEYLATRDHPATSDGNREFSTAPACQLSTASTTYSSTPTSPSSDEETTVISNNGPDVAYTRPEPTITSLIDEYLATRDHPATSDRSSVPPSAPALQTPEASGTTPQRTATTPTRNDDSTLTSSTSPDDTNASPAPTITSLIDDYLSTRTSPVPTEQRREYSTTQDNQTTGSEPPQYSEVMSGMYPSSTTEGPAVTAEESSDDAPPPSYESLFGESES